MTHLRTVFENCFLEWFGKSFFGMFEKLFSQMDVKKFIPDLLYFEIFFKRKIVFQKGCEKSYFRSVFI